MNIEDTKERAKASLPSRSVLVVVGAPLLFVLFGLVVPLGWAIHLMPGVEVALGFLLAAEGAVIYLVDRRLRRLRANGAAAEIRLLVAVMIGCALGAWAMVRRPLPSLARSAELWVVLGSAILLFLLILPMRRAAAKRAFFLDAVLRSIETRTSTGGGREAVAAATRDFAIEAGEADSALRRVRRWLIFFVLWGAGVLTVTGWILQVSTAAVGAGLCATAVVSLYGLTILARMEEDQRFLMQGVMPSEKGASLKAAGSFLVFAAACVLSVVFSLHAALVSQSSLAAVIAWIAALIARIPSPAPRTYVPLPVPHHRPPPGPELFGRLGELAPSHGWPLLGRILTYLGWSIVAIVAAAFLWMLLSPLFRLRYRPGGFTRLARALIAAAASALAAAAYRVKWLAMNLIGLRSQAAALPPIQSRRPAAGSRRRSTQRRPRRLIEMVFGGANRRVVRAFLRMTQWGERHGVPFSRSMAPREYAEMVASKLPSLRPALEEAAMLYERHLFARTPLGAAELAAYYRRIGAIVHYGKA